MAAHRKKNQIDFFNDLLKFYVEAQQHNYEETIADLLEKQNALCDAIRIYQKRLGRVYDSPADQTSQIIFKCWLKVMLCCCRLTWAMMDDFILWHDIRSFSPIKEY